MPNTAIKKVSIQNSASTFDTRDFGAEAQDIDISYDSNRDIIEDITAAGVVIAETGKLTTALKEAQTALAGKASATALASKASLVNGKIPMSLLPDYVDDVIEGYYNTEDGKFYREDTYQTEIEGQAGKIYVDLNTNAMYRWSGSVFVEIINLSELDIEDLSDVDVNSLQDGQALIYDSNAQKWVNGSAALHIVQKPTVTIGTYTYNGQPQGPTIVKSADFDTYVETENATAVNAGTYTLRFKLKNTQTDRWNDLTTADITYTYTINKAAGIITFDENSVTLDDDHKTATVNVTASSTGSMSVSSSDTGICTASIVDGIVTIIATEEGGETTVVVSVAADSNYLAASASIAVTANFVVIKSFSLATDTELKDMLDAYYADKVSLEDLGWHVGDTRVMHFNQMNAPSPQASGSKWAAQDIVIVIVATEHTDLATPINGHSKACITVQTREEMNNNTSTGYNLKGHIYIDGDDSYDTTFTKWSNLYMRTYLNSTVLGAIPSGDFKSSIKQSKHYRLTTNGNNPMTANTTDGSKTDRTVEQVTDTLFLPSYTEIFGNIRHDYYLGGGVPNSEEGTQFEWYQIEANRIKQGNNNGNKNGVNQTWWLSSANSRYRSDYGYYWCYMEVSGIADYSYGGAANGLAPAWVM